MSHVEQATMSRAGWGRQPDRASSGRCASGNEGAIQDPSCDPPAERGPCLVVCVGLAADTEIAAYRHCSSAGGCALALVSDGHVGRCGGTADKAAPALTKAEADAYIAALVPPTPDP